MASQQVSVGLVEKDGGFVVDVGEQGAIKHSVFRTKEQAERFAASERKRLGLS